MFDDEFTPSWQLQDDTIVCTAAGGEDVLAGEQLVRRSCFSLTPGSEPSVANQLWAGLKCSFPRKGRGRVRSILTVEVIAVNASIWFSEVSGCG